MPEMLEYLSARPYIDGMDGHDVKVLGFAFSICCNTFVYTSSFVMHDLSTQCLSARQAGARILNMTIIFRTSI